MEEKSDQIKRMFNNEKDWKANMMAQEKVDLVFMYRILIGENDRLRKELKSKEIELELLKANYLGRDHSEGESK